MVNTDEKQIKFNEINFGDIDIPGILKSIAYDDKEQLLKILEANDIDWNNIPIPYAKNITKWNAANIDPEAYNTVAEYVQKITSSEHNILNNMVDWHDPKFDYLTAGQYGSQWNNNLPSLRNLPPKDLIPEWAKGANPKITNSRDIIDILNYLLWRVVSIDYFTNYWDHRNATIPEWFIVMGWDSTNLNSINYEGTSTKFGNYFLVTSNSLNLNIKLIPSNSVDNINILEGLDDLQHNNCKTIYNYYKSVNSLAKNLMYLSIYSSSPARMSLISPKQFPDNTFNLSLAQYEDSILYNSKRYYKFKLAGTRSIEIANVKGTGNYRAASLTDTNSWLYKILTNINDYEGFDPYVYNCPITFIQTGGPDAHGTVFTETERTFIFNVEKTGNSFAPQTSLSFGTVSGTLTVLTSDNPVDTCTTIRNFATIPYYIQDEGNSDEDANKYKISFELTYGEEYGITPYFFISETNGNNFDGLDITEPSNNMELDENNNFVKYTSPKYGVIRKEDDGYYYIPPEQTKEEDWPFYINVICYYNDNEKPRQVKPLFFNFGIKLKARIINRIIFLTANSGNYSLYRNGQLGQHSKEGDGWVMDSEKESNSCCNYNSKNNISYCIRTITYEDLFKDQEVLVFDRFTTSYCDDNVNVEYKGFIKSDTSKRDINIVANTLTPNINDESNKFNLEKINTIKLGESKNMIHPEDIDDKTFYYCSNNDPENYSIDNAIKEFLNNEEYEILENNDITNVDGAFPGLISTGKEQYLSGHTKPINLGNNKTAQYAFDIKKSTAMFPLLNGIINDNSTLMDADNDYFYLVFKVSCNTGQQGTTTQLSYTACLGYYFLKVIRKYKQIESLSFNDRDIAIEYMAGENGPYSFRLIPRLPIYLNRLFSEDTQKQLIEYDGIFDWGIHGYHDYDENSSAYKLNDKVVAIIDENTHEEFIKIFNEGDQYPYKTLDNDDQSQQNYNIACILENRRIIDFSSNDKDIIHKFDGTNSGAILFINKLMKAERDPVSGELDEDAPYSSINADYINIDLYLNIGNSSKYKRYINVNSGINSVMIKKRTYDIDIAERVMELGTAKFYSANKYNINTPMEVPNVYANLHSVVGSNNEFTTQIVKSDTFRDLQKKYLYLYSNEFGTDTSSNINQGDFLFVTTNNGDNFIYNINSKFMYASEYNKNTGKYSNSGINIKLILEDNNHLNNENWIVKDPIELNDDKKYFILALDRGNVTNINERALWLLGLNNINNSLFDLHICADTNGVYADSHIKFYIKVVSE